MRYRIGKRVFDISLALALAALLALPFLCLIAVLAVTQGRPIFHTSARMRTPTQTFVLWKFRTMRPALSRDMPTGGYSLARITPLGKALRRLRVDEVPQIWNILKGDMSFVGPRPPLPGYVARNPDIFAQVLQCRTGLTGLATLSFHDHEERLLSRCRTPAETEAVYARRCIPRKARLDLIYLDRRSFRLDLLLLAATLRHLVVRERKTAPLPGSGLTRSQPLRRPTEACPT